MALGAHHNGFIIVNEVLSHYGHACKVAESRISRQ